MQLTVETEFEEFKEGTSQTSRALESISAMLNKHGVAKVYFGVKDNGEVIGQQIGNKTIKDLSQAIAERIKPTVIPTITIETYDDKVVLVVEAKGNNKPYSADGEYRIRSGSENRKLDPEQLKDLIFTNSTELITEIESVDQDLTFTQLKQLYIIKGLSIDNKTFEKNTGLYTQNGKYNELAEILSDNNNCSIKVVRFDGIDKLKLAVRNEYGYKCMLLAMQQALEYVNSLNETRVSLEGNITRKEIKLFDEDCLKEAWVNACLHNKWVKMVPPVINIFSNRIEVVSTGGLPVDYSLDDFFNGISHPINIQLQKIMGQLGFIEQTGHGVPKIVSVYGREAFEITNSHIKVTLPFAFEPNFSQSANESLFSLSDNEKNILGFIRINPSIKSDELAKITNLSVPRINQLIKSLKDKGIIERLGSNRSGSWKII